MISRVQFGELCCRCEYSEMPVAGRCAVLWSVAERVGRGEFAEQREGTEVGLGGAAAAGFVGLPL